MSPQYGELRPTSGSDPFWSLGHPSKFQQVSRLGFVSAGTSLTGGRQTFAGSLVVSWVGTLCIHFEGSYPLTEFCQLQNSLCVQVLHFTILTALLHGTAAAGVSQALRCGTRNAITELLQRAPPIFGWAAITFGIGPHSSLWSPYGIGQTVYIFMLWFVLSFFLFFSSPNLSRRRLDVCHTSTHGVALMRI